jgi:hypothetical protein
MVYPRADNYVPHKDNILQVVYDHGKVPLSATGTTLPAFALSNHTNGAAPDHPTILSSPESLHAWPIFDDIKGRVQAEWEALPKVFDPVSQDLRNKIKHVLATGPN